MSMLDSFFVKGFKASKCKTLLKLTIPRIKLLRNRREIQIKHMRRDIAKLLESGQEATARIRVEHIIREEKMMAAQEILELFSELIAVRLPIIEVQRDCPLDLKEAISSVCFAAPRCADLPELLQVQMSFASKYGKEFVAAATELMPDCGVNRQLIELLSIRAPSPEEKLKLLKDIAEEHGFEWDPTASEAELLKSHEDLLNGPTLFGSESIVPLPKEKHEKSFHGESNHPLSERPGSETSLQMLDFPDVPKESVPENLNDATAPEAVPMPTSASCEVNDESLPSSGHDISEKNAEINAEHKEVMPGNFTNYQDEEANALVASKEGKQFVPFIAPPPDSPELFSAGLGAPQSSADSPGSFSAGLGAPQTSVDTPESFSARLAAPHSSFSRTESDATSVPMPTSASCEVNDESLPSSGHDISEKNAEIHAEHKEVMPGNVTNYQDEEANALVASKEGKQFVPFIAPSPDSPELFSAGLGAPQSSADSPGSFSAGLGAPRTSVDTPESFSARLAAPHSSFSRTESDATSVDLQDVVTAAQVAADSAERAAAAARSAASLAQLRISELAKKKSIAGAESGYGNPFHVDIQDHSARSRNLSGDDHEIPSNYHEKVITPADTGIVRDYGSPFHVDTLDHSADGGNVVGEDHEIPSDYHDKVVTPTDTSIVREESGSPSNGSFLAPKFDGDLPDSSPPNPLYGLANQRSTSIEDESYFAYPNLFSSQDSLKSPPAQPFMENVRSSHEP